MITRDDVTYVLTNKPDGSFTLDVRDDATKDVIESHSFDEFSPAITFMRTLVGVGERGDICYDDEFDIVVQYEIEYAFLTSSIRGVLKYARVYRLYLNGEKYVWEYSYDEAKAQAEELLRMQIKETLENSVWVVAYTHSNLPHADVFRTKSEAGARYGELIEGADLPAIIYRRFLPKG